MQENLSERNSGWRKWRGRRGSRAGCWSAGSRKFSGPARRPIWRGARLDRVRQLLAETDMPVAEIAEQAGYGAPEYMTAMFQRKFSITPLRYRKDMRRR